MRTAILLRIQFITICDDVIYSSPPAAFYADNYCKWETHVTTQGTIPTLLLKLNMLVILVLEMSNDETGALVSFLICFSYVHLLQLLLTTFFIWKYFVTIHHYIFLISSCFSFPAWIMTGINLTMWQWFCIMSMADSRPNRKSQPHKNDDIIWSLKM